MGEIGSKIALVLLFILIASVFVAFEIALVSLRDSQVQQLASRGRRGAVLAKLLEQPTRFLAAAQVGITVTSFVSAALGASEIAPIIEPKLKDLGLSDSAGTVAFIGVTLIVAYVSLVIGELVPKRLAIQRAETIALIAAYPVEILARVTRPIIALLTMSTNLIVRLFGVDPHATREAISGEELRDIVAAHEELSEEERELIDEVFEAGNRELREVMVPRRVRRITARKRSRIGSARMASGSRIGSTVDARLVSPSAFGSTWPVSVTVQDASSSPSIIAPVSPMKMRAGFTLCGRNPRQMPVRIAEIKVESVARSNPYSTLKR